MARSLRIVEPGLWHHVMNRGRGGEALFLDDGDRQRFLELLSEIGPRWDVWPAAYCLMDNHYHALLHDSEGRLSRAMRHVDGVYTQRFNRHHNTDGSLMRGRFRSRVVQAEGYVVEVVRYIHTNPIGPGRVERAGDYPWSSHPAYLADAPHDWLNRDDVLELLGLVEGHDASAFDAFVHERVDAELAERLDGATWSAVLGDESFTEDCRRLVRGESRREHPEIPEGRRFAALDIAAVLSATCSVCGLSRVELLRSRRGRRNLPRMLAVLLCRQRTPASGKEIGVVFGIRPSSVSWLAKRAVDRAAEEPEIRRLLGAIEAELEGQNHQPKT